MSLEAEIKVKLIFPIIFLALESLDTKQDPPGPAGKPQTHQTSLEYRTKLFRDQCPSRIPGGY